MKHAAQPLKPVSSYKTISRLNWPVVLISTIWLFVGATSLLPIVPLTYDEAWNFSNIVANGSRWIATNYPYPNNHVLFSLAQSLFLQHQVIEAFWPPLLRLVNVALGLTLLILCNFFLKRLNVSHKARAAIILILVFGAPIYTTYFFVARGYLLACLLLLMSLASLHLGKKLPSMLLLALSIYAIPTFLFALPGIAVFIFLSRDIEPRSSLIRHLIRTVCFFGGTLILTGLFYSPIWKEVFLKRHNFSGASSPTDFSIKLTTAISSFGGLGSHIVVIALLILFWLTCFVIASADRKIVAEPSYRFALLCSITAVFAYLTCLAAILFIGINIPFLRSLCFIPLLFQLSLGLLIEGIIKIKSPKSLLPPSLAALYSLQGLVGVFLIISCFFLKSPLDYPNFMELTPSPLERCIHSGISLSDQELIAVEWNQPVLSLYGRPLGYSVSYIKENLPRYSCICGDTPPPPHQRIAIKDGGSLLCY